MKKPMNKDLKAILLCGAATLMGIISIFTTDARNNQPLDGLLRPCAKMTGVPHSLLNLRRRENDIPIGI